MLPILFEGLLIIHALTVLLGPEDRLHNVNDEFNMNHYSGNGEYVETVSEHPSKEACNQELYKLSFDAVNKDGKEGPSVVCCTVNGHIGKNKCINLK